MKMYSNSLSFGLKWFMRDIAIIIAPLFFIFASIRAERNRVPPVSMNALLNTLVVVLWGYFAFSQFALGSFGSNFVAMFMNYVVTIVLIVFPLTFMKKIYQ